MCRNIFAAQISPCASTAPPTSLLAVHRRAPLIASFLLALWLLATHHAVFEAAGLMCHASGVSADGAAPGRDMGQYRWHQVEKTLLKQKIALPAKPGVFQAVDPNFSVGSPTDSVPAAVVGLVRPHARSGLTYTPDRWRHVQRAAAWPGAPSGPV